MAASITLSTTQTRITPPLRDLRMAATIVVHNPSADTPCYLNVWDELDGEGSPARPIADVMDQLPIAAGFNGTIVLDRMASTSLVMSASTGVDGTGSATLVVGGIRWVAG